MKKKIDYETSSGNVFADLGLPNPEERLAKAKLAMKINHIIEEKEIRQTEAAKLLETDQAKISALSQGKLAGFSLERLIRFLNILDQDITIKIKPKLKTKRKAAITVNSSITKKAPIHKPVHSSHKGLHAQKKNK